MWFLGFPKLVVSLSLVFAAFPIGMESDVGGRRVERRRRSRCHVYHLGYIARLRLLFITGLAQRSWRRNRDHRDERLRASLRIMLSTRLANRRRLKRHDIFRLNIVGDMVSYIRSSAAGRRSRENMLYRRGWPDIHSSRCWSMHGNGVAGVVCSRWSRRGAVAQPAQGRQDVGKHHLGS